MTRRPPKPPDLPLAQTRLVPLNELGYRVGEGHGRAKITDEIVKEIRDLHELQCLSYVDIAAQLGLNLRTVEAIGGYRRRTATPHSWKRIPRADHGNP